MLFLTIWLHAQDAAEIQQRLDDRRVTVDCSRGETLGRALDAIRDALDCAVTVEARDGARPVTMRLSGVTAKSALRLMLAEHGLTVVYRDGGLAVVARTHAVAALVTRVYDLSDLVPPDLGFAAPKVTMSQSLESGG